MRHLMNLAFCEKLFIQSVKKKKRKENSQRKELPFQVWVEITPVYSRVTPKCSNHYTTRPVQKCQLDLEGGWLGVKRKEDC
jgi:hypothetical protein